MEDREYHETQSEDNTLNRKRLISRLIEGLTKPLSKNYEKLVPAQTWTVYWITHSLSLLEQPQFLESITKDVIEFISECEHPGGGYGGGPGQIAHLATTFAAINALITTSSEEALDSIDRVSLVRYLHRMKQTDGSFRMHDDGEIDSRATYCALAVLRCLNIQDSILLENVSDWILSCQTYEGGFGSVPGSEAHGGYTFCSVASLCLMNELKRANIPALLRWLTSKQLPEHGGFCGRSNKFVDSCYSYWQGAIFPLIHPYLNEMKDSQSSCTNSSKAEVNSSNLDSTECSEQVSNDSERRFTRSSRKSKPLDEILENWVFDTSALQDYILNQCQTSYGLLRDKPGAQPDFYHTCYALSGLSISQHQPNDSILDIGSQPTNQLRPTHPLFNLTPYSLKQCFEYFMNKRVFTFKEGEYAN